MDCVEVEDDDSAWSAQWTHPLDGGGVASHFLLSYTKFLHFLQARREAVVGRGGRGGLRGGGRKAGRVWWGVGNCGGEGQPGVFICLHSNAVLVSLEPILLSSTFFFFILSYIYSVITIYVFFHILYYYYSAFFFSLSLFSRLLSL